ncbi:MAG: P-II family nitrogen regulator [Gemmatimonadaceae bacterium]|nr:P-II family nitrogen regulator [Gemmatimonadaceae bacterium]
MKDAPVGEPKMGEQLTSERDTRGTTEDLWMVLAIIQPFKLDAVVLALEALPGFGGMTVSPCRGFGHVTLTPDGRAVTPMASGGPSGQRGWTDDGLMDFTGKIKLEIAVPGGDHVGEIINTIARTAHTGNPGDGMVFAWQLARAVRVRTFEAGRQAL